MSILQSVTSFINRTRSSQAGHPSGVLGRIIGRLMVKDTGAANDRSVALLGLDSAQTVLEVGFGQGSTLAKLLRDGHRVLGVEVSATMLNQASARNRRACRSGRATLVEGDGESVPFETDAADAALTTHTLYFMPDPARTLADIARVLRPGGRLVVATRLSDDPTPTWMDLDVYRIPSRQQVLEMLGAAGFDDVVEHADDDSGHDVHWFVSRILEFDKAIPSDGH